MAPCGRDAGYVKGKEDSQRHVGCALGAASKAATIESAAALHACDIVTVGADVRTHDQEPIHALPQHAEELHASPCGEDGECCMSLRADDVDFAYRKSPIGLVTAGDSSSSVTSSPSLAKPRAGRELRVARGGAFRHSSRVCRRRDVEERCHVGGIPSCARSQIAAQRR